VDNFAVLRRFWRRGLESLRLNAAWLRKQTHGQIHGAANAAKNFAQSPIAVKPNLKFGH